MSLEAAVAANTAALERLTAVLQSAGIPSAPAASAPAPAAARRGKATAADSTQPKGSEANPLTSADAAADLAGTPRPNAVTGVNDGKSLSVKLQAGDPQGTRYFHIAAHNTVAAIKPGEVIPTIDGIIEIDGDEYTGLKAKYSGALTGAAGNAAATSTPAAAATPAAQTASPVVQPQSQAASTTADSGVKVMELAKALHARDGNDVLAAFLKAQGVGRVGEIVAATDKHPAAIAALDALLNPVAAAAPNLF